MPKAESVPSTPPQAVPLVLREIGAEAPGADAELLALHDKYVALEAERRRLLDLMDETGSPADVAAKAALDVLDPEYDATLSRLGELPARTAEGLRAKARTVLMFYDPGEGPEAGILNPILRSMLREVAGVAA